MSNGKKILYYSTIIIVGLYFLFLGLVEAKSFLAPFITAVVLALIILPVATWMEKKKIQRSFAALFSTLIIFIVSLGFMALLSFQVKAFVEDWPKIKEAMAPKVEQVQSFITQYTPATKEDVSFSSSKSSIPLMSSISNKKQKAFSIFSNITGFFGTYLLVFIYIYFLLILRGKFRQFLIKLSSDEKRDKVNKVIQKSAKVTQQYLVGKLILMGILAVVYSIGLGISGVNNFILISIIASLLTIIPYVGNLIGIGMALAFGYLTSGETGVLIGILATFTIGQFLESYILQPYVVGDKVDLHPSIVIIGVVVAGAIWGVIGMILAIPILAILCMIFLNVPALEPYGYLLSKKKKGSSS